MNFWDTSALVALSVDEPHCQTALLVLEADEQIIGVVGLHHRVRRNNITAGT